MIKSNTKMPMPVRGAILGGYVWCRPVGLVGVLVHKRESNGKREIFTDIVASGSASFPTTSLDDLSWNVH